MDLHRIFEHPQVFECTQMLNPWTVGAYRRLALANVPFGNAEAVLDIGSGVGVHKALFPGARYTGIDINPEYVRYAIRKHGEGFVVMDAGAMTFKGQSFDHALSVATCHHLDDGRIQRMAAEVLRVLRPGGAFHVIDPLLPRDPAARLKRRIFLSDRGRNQRTFEQMVELLQGCGHLDRSEYHEGPLHDVGYFRLLAS